MKDLTFLTNLRSLKSSQLAREKVAKGEKVISLGQGEMWQDTPAMVSQAAIRGIVEGLTRYSNPLGLAGLREKIVETYNKSHSANIDVDQALVTNGAKGALFLVLMALLEKDDVAVVVSPGYVSYKPLIKLANPTTRVIEIGLEPETFAFDWRGLREAILEKPKLLLFNFPHNPTGKMLSHREVKLLSARLKDFKGYVVCDEIYEELIYDSRGKKNLLSRQKNLQDRLIKVSSYSKAYCMTGWRIGYLVSTDKKLVDLMGKIQLHLLMNVCAFIQKGAEATYELSESWIEEMKMELKAKKDTLVKAITRTKVMSLKPPQAGMFAFVNIEKTKLESDEFATRLLKEKGVMVNPGIIFGKEWDGFVRVSLGANPEEFEIGVGKIVEFVGKL